MIAIERKKLEQVLDVLIYASSYCDTYGEIEVVKEALAQPPEPRNFCPRCGKRTADLTVIHTCTPPEGGHQ